MDRAEEGKGGGGAGRTMTMHHAPLLYASVSNEEGTENADNIIVQAMRRIRKEKGHASNIKGERDCLRDNRRFPASIRLK